MYIHIYAGTRPHKPIHQLTQNPNQVIAEALSGSVRMEAMPKAVEASWWWLAGAAMRCWGRWRVGEL